ncbi:MAG: hypothetical protein IT203_12930 [Fimbriimonadaceae bacterium]|nr:hypothetical protein [Fimbriimonadaceae bacterium]
MPLVHATSLALTNGQLYVGTNTGDIQIYDSRTREPLTVLTSERKGIIGSVAVSKEGVAWLVGTRPAGIRDPLGSSEDPANQTLVVRASDGQTSIVDLKPAGVTETVTDVAWFGSRVALIRDFGVSFFDARIHAVVLSESILPKTIAEEAARSHVWFSSDALMTSHPVAVRRSPRSQGLPYVSLFTVYRNQKDRWTRIGGFASNALDVEPVEGLNVGADGKIPASARFTLVSQTADLDGEGIVAIEGDSLLSAPIFKSDWETSRKPLPDPFAAPGRPDSLWLQAAGPNMWWWTGNVLLSQNRTTGEARAFLPWNDPQMLVNDILADSGGVWLATNVGVRRLELATPERPLGFGGFVAVPLGIASEKPPTKDVEKLVKELFRWRFATPDLAGKDGAKMVGEVFRTLDIALPDSATGILASPLGKAIVDEIRVGDVIASPKGLAVYIGNGKTVEMRDGIVKNGDVWSRPFATVRRFLK